MHTDKHKLTGTQTTDTQRQDKKNETKRTTTDRDTKPKRFDEDHHHRRCDKTDRTDLHTKCDDRTHQNAHNPFFERFTPVLLTAKGTEDFQPRERERYETRYEVRDRDVSTLKRTYEETDDEYDSSYSEYDDYGDDYLELEDSDGEEWIALNPIQVAVEAATVLEICLDDRKEYEQLRRDCAPISKNDALRARVEIARGLNAMMRILRELEEEELGDEKLLQMLEDIVDIMARRKSVSEILNNAREEVRRREANRSRGWGSSPGAKTTGWGSKATAPASSWGNRSTAATSCWGSKSTGQTSGWGGKDTKVSSPRPWRYAQQAASKVEENAAEIAPPRQDDLEIKPHPGYVPEEAAEEQVEID